MKKSIIKKLVCAALVSALIACAVPVAASAEPELRGRISKVNLTVETEPFIATGGSASTIKFSADTVGEYTGYQINPENTDLTGYRNGVMWYDETEGRCVTNANYSGYYNMSFVLTHVYRVEIVVRITGKLIDENSWFLVYGEDDNWESAVVATVNGREATVSKYRNYSPATYLLVSCTFDPAVPDSTKEIQIVEGRIDAPRGGRAASFEAAAGGYQKYYGIDVEIDTVNVHDGVKWHDDTDNRSLAVGETFITGHTYTVSLYFKSNNYQRIEPKLYYINGAEAKIGKSEVTYPASGFNCVLEYTFPDIREAPDDYVSFQVYSLVGPIAGMTPAMIPKMKVTCDNSPGSNCELIPDISKFYYNDVCWVNSATYQPLDPDEEFKKGERYTLIVPIRATGDNRFSVIHDEDGDRSNMWATFIPEIGDEVISTRCIPGQQSTAELDRMVHTYIDFPACEEMAGKVGFTVQTPKENEVINKTVTSNVPSCYRAKNVTWYDDTTEHVMEPGETFTANHHYSIMFEAYTLKGYMFPCNYDTFDVRGGSIPINEVREGIISYKNSYENGDAPYRSFRVTCDMGLCNDSVIEEVSLLIQAPVAGAYPSYSALNAGSGYHIKTSWEGKEEEWWHNPVTYRYYGRNGVQWWDCDSDRAHLYEDETFIEGHRYTAVIYVDADDGYEFYHDKWNAILATAKVNGQPAEIENNNSENVYHQCITYTFTCGAAQGYTVSGTVKSASDPDIPTTVRLTKIGYSEPDYEALIYGISAKYSFNSVENGSYTMYVAKSGYSPVTLTVTVNGGAVNKDVTLKKPGEELSYTPGDINGDKAVNNKDLTRLFQYLSDWDVEVNTDALDVNGDGSVNNKDLTRLFQYLSDWDVEIF